MSISGKSLSQESHIVFLGKILDYHSDHDEINLINQRNISLNKLRLDFPLFDLFISQKNKTSFAKWFYHFCSLSIMNSSRKKQMQEIYSLINISVDGFINGVMQLNSIDCSTLSDNAKNWIDRAQLWIKAYKKFEKSYQDKSGKLYQNNNHDITRKISEKSFKNKFEQKTNEKLDEKNSKKVDEI
ncbi:hypothetical protein FZC35_01135 [Candidatus Cytomitobacter indipagum]|uniref:Uncharacterized protein n=2 Tax=Candidatus Cytomitobacter indipagum TaxID=2601575 RepID=A0A5C0UEA2_9PROT|nr:hypothetical protein FZC35_01135 [Candidatus Cytomitobacter indipagum]